MCRSCGWEHPTVVMHTPVRVSEIQAYHCVSNPHTRHVVRMCVCTLTLIKHMWHMYSTTACITWQSGIMLIWHGSLKSSDGSVLTPPDRNHTCCTSPFPSPLLRSFLHSVWGDCEWRCISSGRASICLAGNSFLFLLSSFSHISRVQAAPHSPCQQ